MATREAAEGERRGGARCWHVGVAAVVAVEAERRSRDDAARPINVKSKCVE
jgi:hypothetical protein